MEQKKILLHRFVSVEKLIDLLENKRIVLINPIKWLDPFEHFISEVRFIKGEKVSHIEYLDQVFGICFTKANESNLMWDSYTQNGNGVRITFENNLLQKEILKGKYSSDNFHFKYVKYIKYDNIMSLLENKELLIKYFKNPNDKLVQYLFNKRMAYRYEEEFRIIYDGNKDEEEYYETISVNITPQVQIQKIVLSPKMPDSDCNAITKYLTRHGIGKNKIIRSLLYKKKIYTTIRL